MQNEKFPKWLKKIPNWTGNQKHLGKKLQILTRHFGGHLQRLSCEVVIQFSKQGEVESLGDFWISSFTLLNRQHVRVDPKINVTSTLSSSFTSVFKSEIGNLIWKKNLNQFIGQLQTSNTLFIFFFNPCTQWWKKGSLYYYYFFFSIYLKHFEGALEKQHNTTQRNDGFRD